MPKHTHTKDKNRQTQTTQDEQKVLVAKQLHLEGNEQEATSRLQKKT